MVFILTDFLLKSIDMSVRLIRIEAYLLKVTCLCRGSSVVEQKPEELRVGGSIPFPGTIFCISLKNNSNINYLQ